MTDSEGRMTDKETRPDTTRRRFVDWLLGTSVGAFIVAVVYPVGRYIVPPAAAESAASSVTLSITPADIVPGTGQIFKFGSSPGILIRTQTGELRAFSASCTHLDCIVQYREDLGHIWCACHNGHFDLNGLNISGPPPRPLEMFTVNETADQIVVSRGT